MRKTILSLAMVIAMVCGCTRSADVTEEIVPETASALDEESEFIEGELIVELSEEAVAAIESGVATKAGGIATAFEASGVLSYERLYPEAGEWEPRHRMAGLHRWYRLKYDKAQPVTKASSSIEDIDGVVYVEPVRKITSTAVFNDPYLSSQWNYYNDGTGGSSYTAGADINVFPVWQNFTGGSKDVIVAVIDSGVDLEHPDLAAACLPAGTNGSKSFLYDYGGYNIYPDDHGTHVSGTIAAINNNGIGVCGVAGGLDGTGGVRIMACQIMHTDPKDPKVTLQGDHYNAFVWAADHGALIAQNSWGYIYKTEADAAASGPGSAAPAIDYFIRYAGCDVNGNQRPDSPMKGGLVFFSAGNDGWRHAWPAEYDKVVAVGAIGCTFRKASYSNYGEWVDICAPGGDMSNGSSIISTTMNGTYQGLQGTSMACPHVSGVAALIVSQFGGPGFTADMLRTRLIEGANHEVMDGMNIGPLVDALGSFSYGGTVAPEKVESVSSSVNSNKVTLSWKVTADEDDFKAYGYQVKYSTDRDLVESAAPCEIPAGVKSRTVESGLAGVGEEISVLIDKLEFETDYYFSVTAFDYCQNFSESSPVYKVTTLENHAPVITTSYTGDYKVKPFETLTVEFSVSDPDGHSFSTDSDMGSDAALVYGMDNSLVLQIIGKNAPEGKYTCVITLTDEYGAKTEYPIEYEILENHPPKLAKEFENRLFGEIGTISSFSLADYFIDEDGEPLQFSFSVSAPNVVNFLSTTEGAKMTTMGYGMVDITIEASDAVGAKCAGSFKVAVRDLSQPVSLFPNPVSTTLNISTAENVSADIRVVNKIGATVYEGSHTVSPFDPVAVNMADCPAGTYYVVIKGGSLDDKYPIVKK